MRRQPRQSGVVLVLVLVVVLVCGVVLASAARRSGQAALQANAALRDLQFRWGAASCQSAVLPQAEALLNEERKLRAPVVAQTRRSLVLGGMTFDLIAGDESAKANVNQLARLHDNSAGLTVALKRVQADSRPLPIDLRPLLDPSIDAAGQPNWYGSFDQAFTLRGPADLAGTVGGTSASACQRVTVWGTGRVNIRRADVAVMREALTGLLSESDLAALDAWRRERLDFTRADAWAHLQLTKEQIDNLASLTTDTSKCHSLWVLARGRGRTWYRLYVEEQVDDGAFQRRVIAW